MANIEDQVESLINEKIQNIGYNIYDVEYVKEGKDFHLKIYIEKPNGAISLDDCEKVNNEISDVLDVADIIKDQYFLEISSTGVEKILKKDKHLEKEIGNEVIVHLFKKDIDGEKQYKGILKSYDSNNVTIIINSQEKLISRNDITQIKTVYNW